MNFICRETVLALLDEWLVRDAYNVPNNARALRDSIAGIAYFPAPNPKELDGRNVMGQTEEEFWGLVDR